MSDMYLVLRHRLAEVNEWVDLGTPTMLQARKAKGLSHEAMGRLLNVSSKTAERYEKQGRVPRHLLPKVAELLDLEIDQPVRQRVTVGDPGLLEEVRAMRRQLERLVDLLDPPDTAQGP